MAVVGVCCLSVVTVATGSCGGPVRLLVRGVSCLPPGGGSSMGRTKVVRCTSTRAAGKTAKADMLMHQADVLIISTYLPQAQLVVELLSWSFIEAPVVDQLIALLP
jgi:hypothetical protein